MLRWMEEPLGEAFVDVVLSPNNFVEKRYGQEVATASYRISETWEPFMPLNGISQIEIIHRGGPL